MLNVKRTASLVTAIVSIAILSLPVAADAGATDASAGIAVESEYVQTGGLNTPVESSGETDSYATEQESEAPVQDRFVYIDGMGETDQHSGTAFEREYVQTGSLVVSASWSGETDAYDVEQAVAAPVREAFVYIDGLGETDQFANVNGSSDFDPSFRLTLADIANSNAVVETIHDERYVTVVAGETDQFAGIESVEVSSGAVYVLLRQPDKTSDVS